MADLCIFREITRVDPDGDLADVPVIIYFNIDSYSPGCPARIRYDENDYPAEGPEYEFSFVRAELDTPSPDEAPLSEAEIADLKTWFEKDADAHEKAVEAAEKQKRDDHRWGDC